MPFFGQGIRIRDTATPGLKQLRAEMHRRGLRSVMARAGVNTVKAHLTNIDSTRANRLGGTRTHFYSHAADSTQFQLQGKGFIISINHVGMALRYYGGRVKPVNRKYLTIPARARAHGKRAREFTAAKVGYAHGRRSRKVRPFYIYLGEPTNPTILYWLVKSVKQRGDKTVLPSMDRLEEGMVEAGGKYLKRLWERER